MGWSEIKEEVKSLFNETLMEDAMVFAESEMDSACAIDAIKRGRRERALLLALLDRLQDMDEKLDRILASIH